MDYFYMIIYIMVGVLLFWPVAICLYVNTLRKKNEKLWMSMWVARLNDVVGEVNNTAQIEQRQHNNDLPYPTTMPDPVTVPVPHNVSLTKKKITRSTIDTQGSS